MTGLPEGKLWTDAMDKRNAARSTRIDVAADATTRLHLYVAAPAGPAGETGFALIARPLEPVQPDAPPQTAARNLKFVRQ
jgi:hypothetical protein